MNDQPITTQTGDQISGWLLAILVLAWMLPGFFGHEPWKPDEGYTIGLVNHIYSTGDWVTPTLTGDPFMEKPPIFFITAALFGRVFSPWLMPLHGAMAMAAIFYLSLTFCFSYLSGKESGGKTAGTAAVLLLMGCVGFLVRPHSAITDQALWTGFSMALFGLLLAGRRTYAGAFWLGTGVGIAFMAKGLLGPGFIGLTALLLPLFCPDRRTKTYAGTLAAAFAFSLPWLIIWPVALYIRSPELFNEWFWINNFGRFLGPTFGFPRLATPGKPWYYVVMLTWFGLPLWPIALAGLWKKGRALWRDSKIMAPLLLFSVGMFFLSCASDARELYLIPLLIPLAVLASHGVDLVPERIQRVIRTAAIHISLFVILFATILECIRSGLTDYFTKPSLHALTSAPSGGMFAFLAVIVYAALYFGLSVWSQKRNPRGWIILWTASITVVWATLLFLFVSVLDYTKGYKETFGEMREHLPKSEFVLESFHFGESQRAILEYYFGIRPHRLPDYNPQPGGEYLLVQRLPGEESYDPGEGWTILWRDARPGDTRELYTLFARASVNAGYPPQQDSRLTQ